MISVFIKGKSLVNNISAGRSMVVKLTAVCLNPLHLQQHYEVHMRNSSSS